MVSEKLRESRVGKRRGRRVWLAVGGAGLAFAAGACGGLDAQNTDLILQRLPGLTAQANTLPSAEVQGKPVINQEKNTCTTTYDTAAVEGTRYNIVVVKDLKNAQCGQNVTEIKASIQAGEQTNGLGKYAYSYGLNLYEDGNEAWELQENCNLPDGSSAHAHALSADAARAGLDDVSTMLANAKQGVPATPELEQAIYTFTEMPTPTA